MENRRKIEPKEIPSRLIPRRLVVFTQQLEILVTTLFEISFSDVKMQFPEGISPELVMCVPLPIKHISLGICGPLPRKHISLYRQA